MRPWPGCRGRKHIGSGSLISRTPLGHREEAIDRSPCQPFVSPELLHSTAPKLASIGTFLTAETFLRSALLSRRNLRALAQEGTRRKRARREERSRGLASSHHPGHGCRRQLPDREIPE